MPRERLGWGREEREKASRGLMASGRPTVVCGTGGEARHDVLLGQGQGGKAEREKWGTFYVRFGIV